MNDHIEDVDLADALRRVSRQRRDYALRYRQELDQRLSLAVYLLLMEGLAREYGIREPQDLSFGPNGKPFIAARPDIHFNLSHCCQAALCVISDRPIGCDVESVPGKLDMDVCRHCFNDREITSILASDNPPLAFTALWTRKEAFLKLTGQGLADSLPGLLSSPEAKHLTFHTHLASDNSYVYTICQAAYGYMETF